MTTLVQYPFQPIFPPYKLVLDISQPNICPPSIVHHSSTDLSNRRYSEVSSISSLCLWVFYRTHPHTWSQERTCPCTCIDLRAPPDPAFLHQRYNVCKSSDRLNNRNRCGRWLRPPLFEPWVHPSCTPIRLCTSLSSSRRRFRIHRPLLLDLHRFLENWGVSGLDHQRRSLSCTSLKGHFQPDVTSFVQAFLP